MWNGGSAALPFSSRVSDQSCKDKKLLKTESAVLLVRQMRLSLLKKVSIINYLLSTRWRK